MKIHLSLLQSRGRHSNNSYYREEMLTAKEREELLPYLSRFCPIDSFANVCQNTIS
jgi:hypothetical protein